MHDSPDLDPAHLIAPAEDRRMFRRITTNLLAHVRLAGPQPLVALSASAEIPPALYEFQSVLVSDMSMTGLHFSSALAYALDAEAEVSLCLNKTPFVVSATIARRIRIDNRHFGYGINFQQHRASKEFRVALAAYLLRQDSTVPPSRLTHACRVP